MHIKSDGVRLDTEAIVSSPEALALFEGLEGSLSPLLTAARWTLLAHRPLPGSPDRYVPTYTVHLAVDGLGIMPEAYLAHDGDTTPEFDLLSLYKSVRARAGEVAWKARIEATYQLVGGLLFDIGVRLPDDVGGFWEAQIDAAPETAPVGELSELQRLARQRRRVSVFGTYDHPDDMPRDDVLGHLGAIATPLVDTPAEVETGWPIRLNATRYEWEG